MPFNTPDSLLLLVLNVILSTLRCWNVVPDAINDAISAVVCGSNEVPSSEFWVSGYANFYLRWNIA